MFKTLKILKICFLCSTQYQHVVTLLGPYKHIQICFEYSASADFTLKIGIDSHFVRQNEFTQSWDLPKSLIASENFRFTIYPISSKLQALPPP